MADINKLIDAIKSKDLTAAKSVFLQLQATLDATDLLYFSGLISQLDGNLDDAEVCYTESYLVHNDVRSAINLATIYNQKCDFKNARSILLKVTKFESREYLYALLDANYGLQDYSAARAILDKLSFECASIAYLERETALLIVEKNIHLAVEKIEQAFKEYEVLPPSILNNYATCLNHLGEHQKAFEIAQLAIAQKKLWQYKLTLSNAQLGDGNYGQAAETLKEILLEVRNPIILNNLMRVYYLKGEIHLAIDIYDKNKTMLSENAEALCTLADILHHQGKIFEADKNYRKSLKVDPDSTLTNWHYALMLLREGNYDLGWKFYRWGFKRATKGRGPYRYDINNEWDGITPLKKLVAWGEQGIGDQLMFMKFIKYIPATVESIELQVDSRLISILKKFYKDDPRVTVAPFSGEFVGAHIPIGDLPRLLWKHFMQDKNRRASFLKYNRTQCTPEVTIGISWRGGKDARAQEKRSLPVGLFRRIDTLFNSNIKLSVLQYNSECDELNFLQQIFGSEKLIIPDYDPIKDIDSWASAIASCDFIVSADNSAVHFAGAFGIPCLLLLGSHHDFRWGRAEENVFYESVVLNRAVSELSLDGLASEVDLHLKHWLHN